MFKLSQIWVMDPFWSDSSYSQMLFPQVLIINIIPKYMKQWVNISGGHLVCNFCNWKHWLRGNFYLCMKLKKTENAIPEIYFSTFSIKCPHSILSEWQSELCTVAREIISTTKNSPFMKGYQNTSFQNC